MNKTKLLLYLFIALIILIAIPITVIQVQKQQNIRQRAAEDSSLTYLTISTDSTGSQNVRNEFESTVHLINNDPSKQITALDITIKDNGNNLNLLEATSISGSGFSEATNSQSSGVVHYIAVNLGNINAISNQGNDIPLLKLRFSAKNANSGTIGISNTSIATLGNSQAIKIPDNANKSGSYTISPQAPASTGNSDSTIAAIDVILAALYSSIKTEADVYTGFGVISWLNIVQMYKTSFKLIDLDDQVTLYIALKNDLSSGKTMEATLNAYRSFLDNNGQISAAGQQFFQKTYGNLDYPGTILEQYDQECVNYIDQKIKENATNRNKPEIYDCQRLALYKKEEILGFRETVERIIKNSIQNPLILALEKYDKAVRDNENADDQIAEIYYQMAKLLQTKENDALAIQFYALVSDNFTASPRVNEAKNKITELKSNGHKAWMFKNAMLIGMFGLDNFIPFGPVAKGAQIGYQTLKITTKFTLRESFNPILLKAAFSIGKEYTEEGGFRAAKALTTDLIKAGIPDNQAGKIAALTEQIAKGITPDEGELNAARKAIQEASEATAKASKDILEDLPEEIAKIDQKALKSEIERIARIKKEVNYKEQLLSAIKKGGNTVKAAQDVLSERVLGYVDDYVGRGFLSAENAKIFRQTAEQMVKDIAEEFGESGSLFWKSIDASKLTKIDELMHKVVASVSYLEHVASGQRFSDHSFRHLYEDLSKTISAIGRSSSFTKRDKIYLTFTSLLHDIGYSAEDLVQRPLNFNEASTHPQRAFEFVRAELQRDLKEVLGGKSAQIIENTLKSDIEGAVGKEGTATIIDAIRKHGDKAFKYSSNNLKDNNRVAAVFALADDLAVDKVPDLYRYPEIAKIVTDFFKAGKKSEIVSETEKYINKLKQFRDVKDSNPSRAAEIYDELMKMDDGDTVLGRFRTDYRQQMLGALEKYRSSMPDVRFKQYEQAIRTTTDLDFPFVIAPAIIEKTSFSLGKKGAHVIIEISEPLYNRLSQAVGVMEAKGQVMKILEDLVIRSSDGPLAKEEAKAIAEKLFTSKGGQLGSGNDVIIKFVEAQREASVLRDIIP